jgi:hypothetical protein
MFYWGLLVGLIVGANIGVIVAGLFLRSKREEQAAMLAEEICGFVDARLTNTPKPLVKQSLNAFPPNSD